MGGRNLAELRLVLGDIEGSILDANDAVASSDCVSVLFDRELSRESSRSALANSLHQCGRPLEALELFEFAEKLHSLVALPGYLGGVRGFKYNDLLISRSEVFGWKVILGLKTPAGSEIEDVRKSVETVLRRAKDSLVSVTRGSGSLLDIGLHWLILSRVYVLYYLIFREEKCRIESFQCVSNSMEHLRRSGARHHIARALLTRSVVFSVAHERNGANADLDEAWDIAERGPMRLHMADIHLYRARLFFREKEYPWREGRNINGEFVTNRTAADDLAAAEKLINECGYHRRDEELADAKKAILGANA